MEQEDIICAICMESFNDSNNAPKLLPCSHTLCLQCLLNLQDNRKKGPKADRFQCPECRSNLSVPKTGIREFPTNRYVLDMMQISDQLTKVTL